MKSWFTAWLRGVIEKVRWRRLQRVRRSLDHRQGYSTCPFHGLWCFLATDYSMRFVKSQASKRGSRIVFAYIDDYHSTDYCYYAML